MGLEQERTIFSFNNGAKFQISSFESDRIYCGIIFFAGVKVHGQQNVVGSLGRNFVGNLFVAKQCKTSHHFVIRLWGRNFVVKDDQRNP